jgi:dTDP-glucose 4,6-dehydratase
MRVLVTGGAGFIGSNYVRTMLTSGYPGFERAEVTVLDKLSYAGNLDNLYPVADHERLRFIHGDIGDPYLVSEIMQGQDYVVNFAAESHVDRSIKSAADFVASNVAGVQVLAQACLDAGVRRLVHVSTDEVYGSVPVGSATEDAPLQPNSPYAASKAGGDLIALAYHRTHGLDVRVTRGANSYGPYQYPEKVIPLFVTNLLDGQTVPLYGDGKHVRSWLHVDDHCRAIQLVLCNGQPGTVYNVGGDTELANLDLTKRLLDRCGADWQQVRQVTDRKGHDRRYSLDDSRLREIGYSPRTAFDAGLAATVDWYRENRRWWQPLKSANRVGGTRPAARIVALARAELCSPRGATPSQPPL